MPYRAMSLRRRMSTALLIGAILALAGCGDGERRHNGSGDHPQGQLCAASCRLPSLLTRMQLTRPAQR